MFTQCVAMKNGNRGCPSIPRGVSLIHSPGFVPMYSANSDFLSLKRAMASPRQD